MRLKRLIDGVYRRVRYLNRRAKLPCDPCCGTQTWYILAVPCYYAPGTFGDGPCQPTPRPYLWVCVDAKLSDTGETIRQGLAPDGCVTFIHNGWCYSLCFQLPDDGGYTTFDPPRLPGALEIIDCGQTIEVVARRPWDSNTPGSNGADCGTPSCPSGVTYLRGTYCDGSPPEPPIYVCAGQVTRRLVTSQFGGCVCFAPGEGVDATLIPPGARVFNHVAYPESNPGVVDLTSTIYAEFRECCQCVEGCVSSPLYGVPNAVCCCGQATLISYATSWQVTRTNPQGRQTISGNGTAGAPNPITGGLPVQYTFSIYAPDGSPLFSDTQNVELPAPGFECGFPYLLGYPGGTGGSFPPPSWCEYGPTTLPCHQDGMGGYLGYDLVGRFGWPTLLPNLGPSGQDGQNGTLTGVCNRSCASLAAELIGTVTNPETQELYEARYNINLTYSLNVPNACRGACGTFNQTLAVPLSSGCGSCGKSRSDALESIL